MFRAHKPPRKRWNGPPSLFVRRVEADIGVVNDLYRAGVQPVRLMIWGLAFLFVAPVPVAYRSLGLSLGEVIQWVAQIHPEQLWGGLLGYTI